MLGFAASLIMAVSVDSQRLFADGHTAALTFKLRADKSAGTSYQRCESLDWTDDQVGQLAASSLLVACKPMIII